MACWLLHSSEHVDSFIQVVQWVRLADLRWMAAVSKHWHVTVVQHVQGLEQVTRAEVECMPAVPDVNIEAANWRLLCSQHVLDVVHWCIKHTTHTALRHLDVGSALAPGWRLPQRFISSLSLCVALEQLCFSGVCLTGEDQPWDPDLDIAPPMSANERVLDALAGLAALPALKLLDLTFCNCVTAMVLPSVIELLPHVQIRRLPAWYLIGGGRGGGGHHVCVAHPGIDADAGAWFSIGEEHTYTAEGKFVFEPRERFGSGVVNRCWPAYIDSNGLALPTGLILELVFDFEVFQYRPQVCV